MLTNSWTAPLLKVIKEYQNPAILPTILLSLWKSFSDNKCSVSEIESALFLVCLDEPVPQGDDDKRTAICRQLLHGGGVNFNSGNRWFDKCIQVINIQGNRRTLVRGANWMLLCFQFIVGAGGEVGLCYEHTPAEAIPVSMMVNDILKHM